VTGYEENKDGKTNKQTNNNLPVCHANINADQIWCR